MICLFVCLNRIYNNFKALSADYESGEVQPSDLKHALAKALNQILQVTDLLL